MGHGGYRGKYGLKYNCNGLGRLSGSNAFNFKVHCRRSMMARRHKLPSDSNCAIMLISGSGMPNPNTPMLIIRRKDI